MNVTASAATLNKTQFLNLLVAQLQHQDPLNPMDQQEQVAQLAQFSTVEGIEKMNASFSQLLDLQMLSNGSSLLGATVDYQLTDGVTKSGVVDLITRREGALQFEIDGVSVPMANVSAVTHRGGLTS